MTNQEVAAIFSNMADLLEIKGEVVYKVVAYRKAAEAIARETRDLAQLRAEGKLRTIPGVGEAIEKKIAEILDTGKLRIHEELKDQIPGGVISLLKVPGVGPKRARLLYEKLGITSIADLEAAARAHQIRDLPGLGDKVEENILHGIEQLHRRSTRYPLGEALPVAEDLITSLARYPKAKNVTAAGSLRRRKPTVGDIDILCSSDHPEEVVHAFVSLPRVREILSQGDVKASVILDNGIQADLMVLPADRYGSLLQHFTGSKEHNIHLREIALTQGLSFSENGYRKSDGSVILCPREEDVYATIGLPWIPPELREDMGEFEAARVGQLPHLIELKDIKGDLHVHSNWSDGVTSIAEIARAGRAMGYEYVAVADHSKGLGIARGLTVDRLRERQKEIDHVNDEMAPFRVLSAVEVDILADGSLDLPDDILAELDLVIASVHSSLRQDRATMTHRLITAIRHPHVDIIGHPTGVILGEREPSDLDFEAILAEAAKTGTCLEINGNPARLDLDDIHARRAVQAGVMLAISTDAHRPDMLETIVFGVAMARRGWAEKTHILNTLGLHALMKRLAMKKVKSGSAR